MPMPNPTNNNFSEAKTILSQGKMSGADILIQSLINNGVTTIFAYPGGFSIPLHQAMTRFRDKLRVVLPRNEQGGGFAAQGFARATGRVGVCMATSGPGATNLVTTIADAKMDSIPIIAITGQVGTDYIGSDAFQETPMVEVCRSITKHHYLVTEVNDLTRIVREAVYIATTGRPGPVLIDIPKNIQVSQCVPNFDAEMNLPGYNGITETPSDTLLDRVIEVIRKAKRPVIYAGGGIVSSGAATELLKLAETTQIPVTTTMMGLSIFPRGHELALGMVGMHGTAYANHAVYESDLLLALGVRFDDRVTGEPSEFARQAAIVHVEIDPSEINKVKEANIPIVGDVKTVLQGILDRLKSYKPTPELNDWHHKIDDWKKEMPLSYNKNSPNIVPQYAIEELWKATQDRETIIATGVGQHQMWSTQYYRFTQPRTWISSAGLGTMGFGLPAAMGAKLACPEKLVVDIDGDGSFQMNIQEMATCYCEKIPVKVMLLNNQHLGMVVQWEDRFHKSNRAQTYLGPIDNPETFGKGTGISPAIRYPDYVTIAKGYGWEALHISEKSQLPAAIRQMINSPNPFLLDIVIPYQEHVLPMIPAGTTVQDMIHR
ncbi:MAG: biosynthetic-type acetolactate synthase large subunit [Planctomycetaceae bacterium]|jgi:acetolactate synthase-1/2/3 large subunit|nr:biosynthetic-type acetolactate synthase large subunit [Planctomycetaceae bacterium]